MTTERNWRAEDYERLDAVKGLPLLAHKKQAYEPFVVDASLEALWRQDNATRRLQLYGTDEAALSAADSSPLGSELSSLPPLDLSSSTLGMPFVEVHSGHPNEEFYSAQLDSAAEDYTQTWRRLVHESSLLEPSIFHSCIGLDTATEPTPPLAFDSEIPAASMPSPVASTDQECAPAPNRIEVVAPRPVRVTNPAIHLAALVEADGCPVSDNEDEETKDTTEGAFVNSMDKYGYTLEQLEEYMSESDDDDSEEDDRESAAREHVAPYDLSTFQFTYPSNHDLLSAAQVYDEYPSPTSPATPPESPISPVVQAVSSISRASQLRDVVKERRTARIAHYGHSRHLSVPNIQYRPAGWDDMTNPDSLASVALRRRGRAQMSQSVDWSALNAAGSTGTIFLPAIGQTGYVADRRYAVPFGR